MSLFNPATIGGPLPGATAGSVLFAGTSGVFAQDNANFFWDDTNNRLGIGTNAPASLLHLSLASAVTNNILTVDYVDHSTSGAAANGFGSARLWRLEDDSGTIQAAGRDAVSWATAATATRKSERFFTVYDTSEREALHFATDGTVAYAYQIGNPPASATLAKLRLGDAISGGLAAGTFFGINRGSGAFDYLHIQNAGVTVLRQYGSDGSLSVPGAGTNSERFGAASTAAGNNSVALGRGALAPAASSVIIGDSAFVAASATAASVVIGAGASTTSNAGQGAVVIGQGAISSTNGGGVVVGNGASGGDQVGIALGGLANAAAGGIALGHAAISTRGVLVIGTGTLGSRNIITSAYIGGGITSISPDTLTINATGGSGSNIGGATMRLAGGKGTGTGVGGSLILATSGVLTSGSTLQTLIDRLILDNAGAYQLWGMSSTTARQIAQIDPSFPTATDASRLGRLVLSVLDFNATREAIRFDTDGTVAYTSLLGNPPASAVLSKLGMGSAISGGSANGTWLGVNAASGFAGDLFRFQVNSVDKLTYRSDGSGNFHFQSPNEVIFRSGGATRKFSIKHTDDGDRFVVADSGLIAIGGYTGGAAIANWRIGGDGGNNVIGAIAANGHVDLTTTGNGNILVTPGWGTGSSPSGTGRVGIGYAINTTPDAYLAVKNLTTTLEAFALRGAASQTAPLMKLQQISSTAAVREVAYVDGVFADSTDASRKGRLVLSVVDFNATREGLRIDTNGTVAYTTLLGVPPASASLSRLGIGAAIASGDSDGTYLGINTAAAYAGRLFDFQVNGSRRAALDADGVLHLGSELGFSTVNSTWVMQELYRQDGALLNFVSSVDGGKYTFSGFDFVAHNPANSTPAFLTYSFGTDATYPDAGTPTFGSFYIFNWVANSYSLVADLLTTSVALGSAPGAGYPGQLTVSTISSSRPAIVAKAANGQLVPVQRWEDDTANIIASVSEIGAGLFRPRDAATTTVTLAQTLGHASSGTPGNGFGGEQRYTLQSSTNADREAGGWRWLWNDATDATRKADVVGTVWDTAEREWVRARGSGSAAQMCVLGAATPLGVQTVNAACTDLATVIALTNQIRAAFVGFGYLN